MEVPSPTRVRSHFAAAAVVITACMITLAPTPAAISQAPHDEGTASNASLETTGGSSESTDISEERSPPLHWVGELVPAVTSAGALAAALAALFTLREMKRQRLAASKPHLAIPRTHIFAYEGRHTPPGIPDIWMAERLGPQDARLHREGKSFSLELHNLGRGPAVSVEASWGLGLEDLADMIRSAQPKDEQPFSMEQFTIGNDEETWLEFRLGDEWRMMADAEKCSAGSLDFVLPDAIQPEGSKLTLPTLFVTLTSVLFASVARRLTESDDREVLPFPEPKMDLALRFFAIDGTSYEQNQCLRLKLGSLLATREPAEKEPRFTAVLEIENLE
jgi:hypothetical protein